MDFDQKFQYSIHRRFTEGKSSFCWKIAFQINLKIANSGVVSMESMLFY